ncbi:MAG: DUF1499 domain-containing protein [Pseudomonadota bacterium]
MTFVTSRFLLPAIFIAAGCTVSAPELARVRPQSLAGCPARPNCVSSAADSTGQRIAPLQLKGNGDSAWDAVVREVRALPRTQVDLSDDRYLHATCSSFLFRFIDDLELLRHDDGSVSIRSAARTGYSDFGVNRRRVATLEKTLRDMGVIQ